MISMFSKEELGEKYDGFARWYNLLRFLDFSSGWRRKLLRSANGNVLDLAIGTGRNFQYYPKDCKITAVDLSQGMLKFARKRSRELKKDITFCITDTENLPFPDNSFDTVVDSLALCTYLNPIAALKEMTRVCVPNGNVLLLEHGRSDQQWLGRWQDKKARSHAKRLGCYWNRNPFELVHKSGLKITSLEKKLFGLLYIIQAKPQ